MSLTNLLLEAKNIYKTFPGVDALKDVSINLHHGEVLILLGENGAGKSTLIKILSGAYKMDKGDIHLECKPISIKNPQHARELGLFTIYQEFCLVPHMSVAENIALGDELKGRFFLNESREIQEASDLLKDLAFDIDPKDSVDSLLVPQKQMVEIAKALRTKGKILMLDEPTAALTNIERDRLFEIILKLKKQGIGIIYISHRLEEIKMIGDRVSILRDGYLVGCEEINQDTKMNNLVQMMTGKKITHKFPQKNKKIGEILFELKELNDSNLLKNISIIGHKGEIIGIFGLPGCGSLELAFALSGAYPCKIKSVIIEGEEQILKKRSPKIMLNAGICHLPADRTEHGLILKMNVRQNVSLSSLHKFVRRLFINEQKEIKGVKELVESLDIKTPSLNTLAESLSGGNQQKILLAKALCRGAKIFLFCEPTRGIDVGAKAEIYLLMNKLVEEGALIIMISSELPEVLQMSDRILVMRKGSIVKEFESQEATEANVLEYAFGTNE